MVTKKIPEHLVRLASDVIKEAKDNPNRQVEPLQRYLVHRLCNGVTDWAVKNKYQYSRPDALRDFTVPLADMVKIFLAETPNPDVEKGNKTGWDILESDFLIFIYCMVEKKILRFEKIPDQPRLVLD